MSRKKRVEEIDEAPAEAPDEGFVEVGNFEMLDCLIANWRGLNIEHWKLVS